MAFKLCVQGLQEWLCSRSDEHATTHMVFPTASEGPVPLREAVEEPLLNYECMFMKTPLANSSYPALAFRLRHSNPGILKSSLAAALAEHPFLAGRIRGKTVALTADGVPFTVVSSKERSAPELVRELDLLRFSDFRSPRHVKRGLEPLLTVKLTRFADGSAVLVMCRSHALLDGTSGWAFVHDWARLARGGGWRSSRQPSREDDDEGQKASATGRNSEALRAALPDEKCLQELSQELLGKRLVANSWKTLAISAVFLAVAPVYDFLWLRGITGELARPRVYFSNDELARIKSAATPEAGSSGDGWVSTQEALTAYLLLTIGRAVLPPASRGRVAAVFLLDARKAIGLGPQDLLGSGLVFVKVSFDGLLQMSLAEVATVLHERCKTGTSAETLSKRWRLVAGAADIGSEFDAMMDAMPKRREYDMFLMLNNQSKRQLPDFGSDASGGQVQGVVSNVGPTLLLPAEDGIQVLLDPTILRVTKSRKTRRAALAALRSEIPVATSIDRKKCADPTLISQSVAARGA
eukprot:CAMPEP_0183422610 /NCGR_PEP_ID=MMETSP0370-20130417/27923_1 /TAXON_ID=268820 /ORGANISM="Peridinium aciculiferum, Strain PAER-2" /LENGTH=522 /DNA_ID=CAMNT_0025606719 /DNA_START=55 /DNA_END=1623 /DNA_ORIENTATION=-